MKIAIDLNDVVRDYTDNFIKTYLMSYNHEYDTANLEIWTNDMRAVLPFKSERAYYNFVYTDFAFELFGKCDVCSRKLATELKGWIKELEDLDEPIEVMFVSPLEYGESIGYSLFFISKLGCEVREVYFPNNSAKIWDKCDMLITANPMLLTIKPEGKKSIKIEKEYNKDCPADKVYSSLSSFIGNLDNLTKIIENV